MKLNIQWKISIALLVLVFCVFSNFIGIQMWISGSKANGKVINFAGSQRMLTQKMTKEAMFIVNGFDVKGDIVETERLFERTLNGLIVGNASEGLPPAKTEEIKTQLEKVKGLWLGFKADIDKAVSAGNTDSGQKKALYMSSLEILREMNSAFIMIEEDSSKAILRLRSAAGLSFLISLIVAAIALYFVRKKIVSQLRGTVEAANSLKDGDLTVRIDVNSSDETGRLQYAMKEMVESLRNMVGQIIGHSHTMASNSEEVSATTTGINQGIDEQAQQIEQAVTATTEVSQTIMDVARNATEASDAAKESVGIAGDGKSVVEQTVSSMMKIAENVEKSSMTIGKLGESSQQIGDIISVINDIASQTNLLALNAAIEAARAGEQGRGFAVVADEVRKLAEKTSKATEEITGMISQIQQDTEISVRDMDRNRTEAEDGVKLAGQAKDSLDKIVNASERCLDMVQSIAAATEEQSAAIEEVSSGMEHVAGVFGTSREAVTQINGATNELAKISSDLMNLVAWFRMDARHAGHASANAGIKSADAAAAGS